jgi:thiamine biosynthesis lipoprotein
MGTYAFNHEAMNSVFDFRIRHADADYARQAAQAAFAEVDHLDTVLSRFAEGSDVWRINHAGDGETVTISDECHECLRLAVLMSVATEGAFNVSIGGAADVAKQHGAGKAPVTQLRAALRRSASALVSLSEDALAVHVERSGISIDLGAIGKGFALDRAGALLREWGIRHALLSAGGSSVLAIGADLAKRHASGAAGAKHGHGHGYGHGHGHGRVYENIITAKPKPGGWVVNVAGDKLAAPLTLHDCAAGSSGTAEQGRHIVDPRRGGQSYTHVRTWALAPNAAVADALSTACMTMMPQEITRALRELGKGHAVITEDTNGRLYICRRSGVWTQIKRTHALSWPAWA